MLLPLHPPPAPVLRPMAEADLPAVVRLQAQCYTEIVPERPSVLDARRETAPRTCWVAERDGDLLAYLLALPVAFPQLPTLDDEAFRPSGCPDTLYLHDLAVSPAARGSGAGALLVRRVLQEGQAQGLARACLVAIQSSAAYWAAHGFRVSQVPPSLAPKLSSYGPDAQLMRRMLSPSSVRAALPDAATETVAANRHNEKCIVGQ